MKRCSRPDPTNELRARSELRCFARLLLPIYQFEYQEQVTSADPCWPFLTMLERRMRQLEKEAQ